MESIESQEYPGFYYISGRTDVVINKKGQIVDLRRDVCPIPVIGSWGYPQVSCGGRTVLLHRLLAETFIPYPNPRPLTKLDVNHIDGIKTNFDLANLEWATRQENCLHAYRTGLRNDNRPVLVKDLRTDEIVRHYSLTECARVMKTDPATMHLHLKKSNRGKISWNYYVCIYEGDEWPEIDKADMGKHRNGNPRRVVVYNIEKAMYLLFDSVGKAAEMLCLNSSTIHMHMRRHDTKPNNGFIFCYFDRFKDAGMLELCNAVTCPIHQ